MNQVSVRSGTVKSGVAVTCSFHIQIAFLLPSWRANAAWSITAIAMRPLPPIALRQFTRGRITLATRGLFSSAKLSIPEIAPKDSPMEDLLDKATLHDAAVRETFTNRRSGSPGNPQRKVINRPGFKSTLETEWPAYVTPRSLLLWTPEERNLKFRFLYLRDLCKCPQCVDPHSKQRLFRTSDIPVNVYARHLKWDGKQLEIHWANDIPGYDKHHISRWSAEYLTKPVINTHDIASLRKSSVRWPGALMQKMQHWVSFEDYMNDDAKFAAAMAHLSRTGLIFVKNVPESREMVEKIATRMGPLRNTFYGSTWDVRTVPEAKNVAYTNQHLGFHMDLMYMNEPPGYQLLHCLENSCEGGESLFADTFRVAMTMRKTHPAYFDALSTFPLGYEYVHEGSIYYNKWPVFELQKGNGRLRRVNYSPPFQSALPWHSFKKRWPNEDPFPFETEYTRALKHFASSLEDKANIFQLKLNAGECVIFANRRIAHARNQFNTSTGSRWLAGAYVDEDALMSRFAVCQRKNPGAWDVAGLEIELHKHTFQDLKGKSDEITERLAKLNRWEATDARNDT